MASNQTRKATKAIPALPQSTQGAIGEALDREEHLLSALGAITDELRETFLRVLTDTSDPDSEADKSVEDSYIPGSACSIAYRIHHGNTELDKYLQELKVLLNRCDI